MVCGRGEGGEWYVGRSAGEWYGNSHVGWYCLL